VLAQPGVAVAEEHALLLEILADAVVHDLRVVLRTHAGEEFALSLRNAETVERLLDGIGDVVPRPAHLLDGLDVVINIVEIEAGQIRAPRGHRPFAEMVECLEAEFQHPFRLALVLRDGCDNLGRQSLRGAKHRDVDIGKAVLVVLGQLFRLNRHRESPTRWRPRPSRELVRSPRARSVAQGPPRRR
jgi:hypothetical protein